MGGTGRLATVAAIAGTIVGAVMMQGSIEDRVASLEDRVATLEAGASVTTPAAGTEVETWTLTGYVDVTDMDSRNRGESCAGQGGYDDLRPGGQVVVRDGAGATLAVGRITDGATQTATRCRLSFTVSAIPRSDIYAVEVTHRGELVYSFADLEALGWRLELSI